MRRVAESELESDFEREIPWGDDERFLFNPNRKKASVMGFFTRLELVVELVKRYSPGPRVADVACAQGTFALMLAEAGFDVTGVDLKEDFLRYAKKKHTHGKFRTVQANLMEFRDSEGFDTLLMGEIIEHVAFPRELLQSAHSNLKPGGILILSTPNGNECDQGLPTYSQVTDITALIPRQFHFGDHLFLFTEEELRGLFKDAGLEVIEVIRLNSSYFTQLKAIRYLMPMPLLKWMEKKTRNWKKRGQDSANSLVVVARRPTGAKES